jgi:ribonuclease HII
MNYHKRQKYIIGIDEVGRGALAGPVVVAAALFRQSFRRRVPRGLGKLRDSKKLSAKKREAWFEYFKNCPDIFYAVARVYPRGIERLNISRAANLAAGRAYGRLIEDCSSPFRGRLGGGRDKSLAKRDSDAFARTPPGLPLKGEEVSVFLDGGLFLGSRELQPKHAKTVIKGDEKICAVAVASIIAKVTRDHFMVRLSKRHAQYGFEIHKGYGTAAHRRALRKFGPCPAHRLTFLKKSLNIQR